MKGRIERAMKRIMNMKVEAGEFSLDLYYNDMARKGEEYTALVVYNYTKRSLCRKHFSASDFSKALCLAEKFIKFGLIEKK